MTKANIQTIEETLGYDFKSKGLLEQAFVRSSYETENPSWIGCNNETLEFFGDKVLDIVVVKILAERYGLLASDFSTGETLYYSEIGEGTLTNLKISLVESKRLASVTEALGLHQYLIMGNGDVKNHVEEQQHVKEDLYEALLGAAALDCGWDLPTLTDIVLKTLDPISLLNDGDPYSENAKKFDEWLMREGYADSLKTDILNDEFFPNALLTFSSPFGIMMISGFGATEKEAIFAAKSAAFLTVTENVERCAAIAELLQNVSEDRAVNQLQELWQKGLVSEPAYSFTDPILPAERTDWECTCRLSFPKCSVSSSGHTTKAEAKKAAAFAVLKQLANKQYVIYNDEEN